MTARKSPDDSRALPIAGVAALALALAGCAAVPAKDVVVTPNAPLPIGPHSQAIKVGNVVFLSGQTGFDPKTNQPASGPIEEQTRQTLTNLESVLKADAMSMANVVSVTVYLRDIDDFAKMNAVYATFFKDKPPARATLQAARLPRDALVEIAAVASR